MTQKPRYALTSDRKASLLNSSIRLHNGRGITSYRRQRPGKLAAWRLSLALAFVAALILWSFNA